MTAQPVSAKDLTKRGAIRIVPRGQSCNAPLSRSLGVI